MNELEQGLRQAAADLTALRARFALVGGFAVSVRAEPRLTRDADIAVAVGSDAEAENLILDLRAGGYTVTASVEHDVTGRLATVRLVRRCGAHALITDLLFASCGIEEEIVTAADTLTIVDELDLPVATVGHLLAMKLLARDDRLRPADADDLNALARVARDADWATAEHAVQLIAQRGYARGRDLAAALTELRSRPNPI